jgi:tetratricopeptide (TPR) repeat protein
MEALGFFIGSLELKLKPPFPMITKEELQYWHEGIVHYTKGDLNTALELFQNAGPYSKLWFNIGMIYSRTNDHDSAEIMYSKAIEQDEYMAVGYLQKGYASFMLYDYVAAIKCFQYALSVSFH